MDKACSIHTRCKKYVQSYGGKGPLVTSGRRLEDNVKIGVKDMGKTANWIYLAEVRDKWWTLVNMVTDLLV